MDMVVAVADFFKELWSADGKFVLGHILGVSVTLLIYWITTKERLEHHRYLEKREKSLIKQFATKEKRIDALHYKMDAMEGSER